MKEMLQWLIDYYNDNDNNVKHKSFYKIALDLIKVVKGQRISIKYDFYIN